MIKNRRCVFTANGSVAATMVRYHRGSLPKKGMDARSRREHEDYFGLERSQRSTLLKLASILQIADGLDRSHGGLVTNVSCQMSGAGVNFHVEAGGQCDLELWSAERKASWFSEIFQISTRFERVAAKQVAPTESAADQTAG